MRISLSRKVFSQGISFSVRFSDEPLLGWLLVATRVAQFEIAGK